MQIEINRNGSKVSLYQVVFRYLFEFQLKQWEVYGLSWENLPGYSWTEISVGGLRVPMCYQGRDSPIRRCIGSIEGTSANVTRITCNYRESPGTFTIRFYRPIVLMSARKFCFFNLKRPSDNDTSKMSVRLNADPLHQTKTNAVCLQK